MDETENDWKPAGQRTTNLANDAATGGGWTDPGQPNRTIVPPSTASSAEEAVASQDEWRDPGQPAVETAPMWPEVLAGMTTTPTSPPRNTVPRGEPPTMALRTYAFLRLGMVGVIAALAVSVTTEVIRSDNCFQKSISAYYYTPTRSVFVGTLVALGLCMIAIWGKSLVEDSLLNLAGMLAPVVAFVPTRDANYCSIVTSTDKDLTELGDADKLAAQRAADKLVEAAHAAVFNNVVTLLSIIGATLLVLGVVAFLRRIETVRWIAQPAFYVPYGTAVLVFLLGLYAFTMQRPWFYQNAHKWSAIPMFVLIIAVVLRNGRDASLKGRWRKRYWSLGLLMCAAAIAILGFGLTTEGWFGDHYVFVVESTLILLFGLFWLMQTFERRHMGAPDLAF